MKQRNRPEIRRDQILTAALALAVRVGYKHITREAVAADADCSPGLITHYFTTMAQLKRAAVTQEIVAVVAQGLADRNPHARRAPDALKTQALSSLTA